MTKDLSRYLIVALIAALAALAALWISRSLPIQSHADEGRLHAIMHEQLKLDANQERKIEELEAQYKSKRAALNAELQEANVELAEAIANEHEYGPAVEHAVDKSHMAMGELQKATLQHVFAMRAVLRPEQASAFDQAVSHALTETSQD